MKDVQERGCARGARVRDEKAVVKEKKGVFQVMRNGKLEDVFRPGSQDGLKRLLRRYLGLNIPDVRVCDGHDSPMDYLWYAYSRDRLYQEHRNTRTQGLKKTRKSEIPSAKFGIDSEGQYLSESNCGRDARVPMNGDCIVWANRGGGKTMLAAMATLLEGLFKDGCQTRILAGSLEQAGRMYGYLRDFAEGRFYEQLDGKLLKESCKFKNGAQVQVLAQSSREVRGQHVQKLRCDEIELFDDRVLEAAKFITQSSARQVAAMEMLSTMHRPYGIMQKLIEESVASGIRVFKWCVWEVIERCTSDRSCSRCPLNEDCRGKARRAKGYLRIDDVITQMQRSSRAGFEAEMLCLRPHLENAVFDEFDPRVHVAEVSFDARLPLYRGIDFGYKNPFVCLFIQVDGDGTVRVFDEYVQSRKITAENAEAIKTLTPVGEDQVAGTFCDPAGKGKHATSGKSEMQVLTEMEIRVQASKSEIKDGLELIRAALRAGDGSRRLVINRKCKQLIKAMESYRYPDTGPSEVPLKDGEHDHLIDALRYFFIHYAKRSKGVITPKPY